jgi:hypothetical protein
MGSDPNSLDFERHTPRARVRSSVQSALVSGVLPTRCDEFLGGERAGSGVEEADQRIHRHAHVRQRVAGPPKENRPLALTAAGLRSVATKSIEHSRVEERAMR